MRSIEKYEIHEKIRSAGNTIWFRATDTGTQTPLIIKTLDFREGGFARMAGARLEYETIQELDAPEVMRILELHTYDEKLTIVQLDSQAMSLRDYLQTSESDPAFILRAALVLVGFLGEIHKRNIVHKLINPDNILVLLDEERVQFRDIGVAFTLEREEIYNSEIIEAILPYISPEQTGRMNRETDSRSDFYSLGAVLYEAFTGRAPFASQDPLEIIHGHIARLPEPPLNISSQLSAVIMKLLAKIPEERYKSAYGLQWDLRFCMESMGVEHPDFQPGQHDVSGRFELSRKLYGREDHINRALALYGEVRRGRPTVLFVGGGSGIGKSAMIQEISKPVQDNNGYFISGKYSQYKMDEPYSALIQAFSALISRLLTENEEVITYFKERLLEELGGNGDVIAGIIPDLELILGPQATPEVVGPLEAQNRFMLVFSRFVKVFARPEHPLVLFLDDVQWADPSGLNLLRKILGELDGHGLFLICTYRLPEGQGGLEIAPPLELDEKIKAGVHTETMVLSPLEPEHIQAMVADTLNWSFPEASELGHFIYSRTEGHPYFAGELLRVLYENKHLSFEAGVWIWAREDIQKLELSEDLIQLLIAKINGLSEEAREVIKAAACIGNRFSLEMLSALLEKDKNDVFAALSEALMESMLIVSGDTFQFAHDRIQEAARSLTAEGLRKRLHYQAAVLALENTATEELPANYFYITNLFNSGSELLTDKKEKLTVARLNHFAAQKAQESAAYESALEYVKFGLALLEEEDWKLNYSLTRSLHLGAVENGYLALQFGEMETYAEILLEKAVSKLERAEVNEIRILAYSGQNRTAEAIKLSLEVLNSLGVKFPEKPGLGHALTSFLGLKALLIGRRIESMGKMAPMRDPVARSASRILSVVFSVFFNAGQEYLPLIVFKSVRLILRKGAAPEIAMAFVTSGLLMCTRVGDVRTGYRMGRLAQELSRKGPGASHRTRVDFFYYMFISPWKNPIRESLAPLLEGYRSVFKYGDLLNGAYCAMGYCATAYFSGMELSQLAREMDKYTKIISEMKQNVVLPFQLSQHQLVLNLTGQEEKPHLFRGSVYTENFIEHIEERGENSYKFQHYYNCQKLAFIFGKYEDSRRHATQAEKYLNGMPGWIGVHYFYLYDSLTLAALFDSAPEEERKLYGRKIERNLRKLKKLSRYSSENYLDKYTLVLAEYQRICGKDALAIELYEKAAAVSEKNGFLHEESLAYEAAGRFYLVRGRKGLAAAHYLQARERNRRWGAHGKVKQIDAEFGELYGDLLPERRVRARDESRERMPVSLDLESVVKASQTLSGEIKLEKLMSRLMKIVIENAGAETGYLLLKKNQGTIIAARSFANQFKASGPEIRNKDRDEDEKALLEGALMAYVRRTGEDLLLHDAVAEERFETDAYIQKLKPRSLLILPMLHHGEVSGYLYLENNLAPGVFTPERVKVLRLIASQAAISLENAGLYADLEKKVRDRTAELSLALENLKGKELELRRSNEKLRELDKMKSDFFANISHEFRTPLTLIMAPLEKLLSRVGPTNPRLKEELERINRNCRTLLKYINNLLDISRLDARKMPLNPRVLGLNNFMCLLTAGFESVAHNKNLTLDYSGLKQEVFVSLDPEKIEQILLNLLSNAIKFTEQGGVSVSLREEANSITVRVQDSGPGIAPEEQEHVFERFHQVKSRAGALKGSGIGLALARELAELHEGSLILESQVGQGSVFTLELPRKHELAASSEPVGERNGNAGAASLYLSEFETSGGGAASLDGTAAPSTPSEEHILIVEDNPDLRQYLLSILSPLYSTSAAEHGREALEQISQKTPDIIISDLMMPHMDGMELLRTVRERSDLNNTAFILLTARTELENRLEGLGEGADDYVGKPFNERELLLKVRNLSFKNLLRTTAVLREREQIFADMHDHLGSQLTDLSIITRKLLNQEGEAAQLNRQLSDAVDNTIFIMKNRLLNIEDRKLLTENYISGLNLILLRRYSNAGRILKFKSDKLTAEFFKEKASMEQREIFYTVAMENATNDLKYGQDVSHWNFEISEGTLHLNFKAGSRYDVNQSPGGGSHNIPKRLKEIGGTFQKEQGEGEINIRIALPL